MYLCSVYMYLCSIYIFRFCLYAFMFYFCVYVVNVFAIVECTNCTTIGVSFYNDADDCCQIVC